MQAASTLPPRMLVHPVPGGAGYPQQEARDLYKLPTQGEDHAGTKGNQGRLEIPFWFGKHCDV